MVELTGHLSERVGLTIADAIRRRSPLLLLLLAASSAPALAGALADEHARCTTMVAEAPPSRDRSRCVQRLAWLSARQDPDGGFRGAEALDALRSDYRSLSPEQARARAADIAAEATFGERVRQEARLWLAREALRRDAPAEARDHSSALWAAVSDGAADEAFRREIADVHTRILVAAGEPEAAAAVEAEAALLRSARPREGAPEQLRKQRVSRLRQASWAILAGFGLVCGPLAAAGWRQARPRPRPRGLVPLAAAIGLAAGLGWLNAPEEVAVFGWLGLGAVGIHLLALGAQLRARTRPGRVVISALAALATLAVGFLAADRAALLGTLGL